MASGSGAGRTHCRLRGWNAGRAQRRACEVWPPLPRLIELEERSSTERMRRFSATDSARKGRWKGQEEDKEDEW